MLIKRIVIQVRDSRGRMSIHQSLAWKEIVAIRRLAVMLAEWITAHGIWCFFCCLWILSLNAVCNCPGLNSSLLIFVWEYNWVHFFPYSIRYIQRHRRWNSSVNFPVPLLQLACRVNSDIHGGHVRCRDHEYCVDRKFVYPTINCQLNTWCAARPFIIAAQLW